MKQLVLSILLTIITLGLNAQAFTIDTTFQPFFDIRQVSAGHQVFVNGITEKKNGKVYFSGSAFGQNFGGVIPSYYNGSQNFNFNQPRNGYLIEINDNAFASGLVHYRVIDTLGQIIDPNWFNTYRHTVCGGGIPYFFKNRSGLFPNGNGVPCRTIILNPPDTFAGRSCLIKVDSLGLWDSTFNAVALGEPREIKEYDSSRLFVLGYPGRFHTYNGASINNLCRIYHDGRRDTTFSSPISDTGNIFHVGNIQADGSFYVWGRFKINGSNQEHYLIKLNANGSIDSNFAPLVNVVDTVWGHLTTIYTVESTYDGGVLIGGVFDKLNGIHKNCIAKLDSNGNVEPQYFNSRGPDSSSFAGNQIVGVNIIKRSQFGGYFVGGSFLKWNGQPSQPIIRLYDERQVTRAESRKSKAKSLKLYPNPTNGLVNLQTDQAIESIRVFDVKGRLLVSLSGVEITSNITQFELPEENGLYFVQVRNEEGEVYTEKVVKH